VSSSFQFCGKLVTLYSTLERKKSRVCVCLDTGESFDSDCFIHTHAFINLVFLDTRAHQLSLISCCVFCFVSVYLKCKFHCSFTTSTLAGGSHPPPSSSASSCTLFYCTLNICSKLLRSLNKKQLKPSTFGIFRFVFFGVFAQVFHHVKVMIAAVSSRPHRSKRLSARARFRRQL